MYSGYAESGQRRWELRSALAPTPTQRLAGYVDVVRRFSEHVRCLHIRRTNAFRVVCLSNSRCRNMSCPSFELPPVAFRDDKITHLVTLKILGSSPGSRKQYETPLNVVPTSNDMTRRLVEPLYFFVAFPGIVVVGRGRLLTATSRLHFRSSP